jgi:hypothetical protein
MGESNMKFTRVVFSILSVCVLFAGTAFAQTIYYVGDETHEVAAPDDGSKYDGCDTKGGCKELCCCPWELFPEPYHGIKFGGWFQVGYHSEGANDAVVVPGGGTSTGGVFLPMAQGFTNPFNNYPGVIQLHQGWIYAEKAAQNCGYGWDWGFRVDAMYGTDGQDIQAFGNPNGWDTSWDNGNFYGGAIPQLYADVLYNDLSVRIGHFFGMIGYERAPAPQNFFYSHSMSFFIQPRTLTGILAQYPLTDRLALQGGWATGYDTAFDANGGAMFIGGVGFDLSDRTSISYVAALGDFGNGRTGASDTDGCLHNVVFEFDVTESLAYALELNYLDNALFTVGAGPFMSINNYLIYTLNCKWAVGGRFEWLNMANNGVAAGNYDLAEATIGVNYRPHPNVTIRPEVRVDAVNDVPAAQTSTVFGIDAILTY